MADPAPFSETETRLFAQLCEATHTTSEGQKNMLRAFLRDELASEWTRLVESMDANGPMSVLTEDELKYSLHMDGRSPAGAPEAGQKGIDPSAVKTASHDILQYNDALEKLLSKYKECIRRSIVNIRSFPKAHRVASVTEQKIAALALRRDLVEKEIHALQGKARDRIDLLEALVRTESKVAENDGDFYDQNYKLISLSRALEATFPSYDHILSRLKALRWELSYDTAENETILQTARLHASQVVLSLATKCRASLDTVFLEASQTYNKDTPYLSGHARAINEERNAVYAEIQSLWDEMVPLAHMVVEKEFLRPILRRVQMGNEKQAMRDAAVSAYISAMLRFMNHRLRVLADRIKMLVYHHQTLFNAFAYVKRRTDPQPIGEPRPTKAHVARSDINDDTDGPTLLENMQRQMELYGSIPIDVGEFYRAPRFKVTKLDRYTLTRQSKGDELARSMHKLFEIAVAAELTDTELGGQLLLDSVVADSGSGCRAGGRVYEDQQVEDSVSAMRSQVEEVQAVFRQLRNEGEVAPSSAPDFVAYAFNKVAKQLATKNGEGCYHLDKQGEVTCRNCNRCLKFAALIRKWDDPAIFTS
ncbi:hypothetical protein GGS23DRAFT_445942 [Durotheca rogersii]|uniref:uncharacterized protein n=1 Tax=Durotheca rogersii TaxID=419775 RepID=UPI00222087FA|nr:uncharacterized protein GGS23DRAFT_445942 [Durotheca rogersii]KAI5855074.1 hypothetical protein GGS23DRAFT_445942 [Durotheca rogersii]